MKVAMRHLSVKPDKLFLINKFGYVTYLVYIGRRFHEYVLILEEHLIQLINLP